MRAHQKHMPTKKKDKILFQNELKFIKKMTRHLKECHKLESQKMKAEVTVKEIIRI